MPNKDIIVKKGTYDIIQEYKALFGENVWNTMKDTDYNGFGAGIFLTNRNITFNSGAIVTADYTGITIDSEHRFSPFAVGMNVTIDGLYCICNGGWYLIHDDYGSWSKTAIYKNEIKNSVLILKNPVNRNVIGGGCKGNSTTIIDNCYCDNGRYDTEYQSETIRYHNVDDDYGNASPTVIIKNTYTSGWIGLRWHGEQTSKMNAIVSNCHATKVEKLAEVQGNENDNINLYAWNNFSS